MPSNKWKIWDFFKSFAKHIDNGPLNSILCKDALVLQEVKSELLKIYGKRDDFKVVFGEDLSLEWWEDNFLSLSLFGNSESYIILNAHFLKNDCIELLSREDLLLEGRKVFFLFEAEGEFYKKLSKIKNIHVNIIEEARHWEGRELLNFWCFQLSTPLSYEAKNTALNLLNHESLDFLNLLRIMQVNFSSEKEISERMLMEVITPTRFNKFELAELFSARKFKEFYHKVIELKLSTKETEELASFLQVHLIKLFDTSLIHNKNYLTKYDKNLIAHSRLWSQDRLQNAVRYFEELVYRARKQDPFLDHEFKNKYLHF